MDILTLVLFLFFLPSLVYCFKKAMSKDIREGINNEVKSIVDEVFDSIAPAKEA